MQRHIYSPVCKEGYALRFQKSTLFFLPAESIIRCQYPGTVHDPVTGQITSRRSAAHDMPYLTPSQRITDQRCYLSIGSHFTARYPGDCHNPVTYTHLTLPTILRV